MFWFADWVTLLSARCKYKTPVHVWADRITSLKMTGITTLSVLHPCHSHRRKSKWNGRENTCTSKSWPTTASCTVTDSTQPTAKVIHWFTTLSSLELFSGQSHKTRGTEFLQWFMLAEAIKNSLFCGKLRSQQIVTRLHSCLRNPFKRSHLLS
jgi:hypothetical protein